MHPDNHFAPKRPDESPTRLTNGQAPRPSALDVSANDPNDRFRPAHCPNCRMNPSGIQGKGYLCETCNWAIYPVRRYLFCKAAAGYCIKGCNRMLSDEDRLAQFLHCRECAPGHGRPVQLIADRNVVHKIRAGYMRTLTSSLDEKLRHEVVVSGRCLYFGCLRPMGFHDLFGPPFLEPGIRFVYCARCREWLWRRGSDEAGLWTDLPFQPSMAPPIQHQQMGTGPSSAPRGAGDLPTLSEPSVFDNQSTFNAEMQRHRM